jgi:hypothetical protein
VIVTLVVVIVCVASASHASTAPGTYAVGATEACLRALPDAVVGLPTASPPTQPAVFVHRFAATHLLPTERAALLVWSGNGGAKLDFFREPKDARSSLTSPLDLAVFGGGAKRNVVFTWEWSRKEVTLSFRRTVLDCLHSTLPAAGMPAPRRPATAIIATFAGSWQAHTRGLRISRTGKGVEFADDGCCDHVYRATLQILSVQGTLLRATATYRLTSFKRFHRSIPIIRTGRTGTLTLSNGIVTNRLTRDFFCSPPATLSTPICGA